MEPCGTPVEIGTRFDIQLSTLHIVYDLLNTNRKHFSLFAFFIPLVHVKFIPYITDSH